MGEVDDGQPVAHLWRQEYDFWSSPLKAYLQKVASFVVCVVLYVCMYVCIFIKLQITAQSGPVIRVSMYVWLSHIAEYGSTG